MMKFQSAVVTAAIAAFVLVTAPRAQEHPEHPQEHPSHEMAKEPVTIDMLSRAIKNYVMEDSRLKGGYFLVFDPVAGAPLALTLDKVHEDKLATLGNGVYFACADFKAMDGRVYDLDIFMKGDDDDDDGDLEATEVSIHKVDGTPRYNWMEKDGVWKKVDAKAR